MNDRFLWIHKDNIPLRPILAASKRAGYKIAKYLVPLIEPFASNDFTLKNSYEFYSSNQGLNNSNTTGYSYDITSLYTNIPVDETINILCDKIFLLSSTFHNFDRNHFCKLLHSAVSNTYFFFNNYLYKQKEGLAMGNPLAPALANVFLCHIEDLIFSTCPDSYKPKFYRRYLDDTFAVFDSETQATNFFQFINSIHKNLSFTIEKQVDRKLPFLDLCVANSGGVFQTSVFRKPSFTGLGLSFFSFCPYIFKINALKTLLHRAHHLSSNYSLFNDEMCYLKTFFENNGYPLKLFDSILRKFLNKVRRPIIPTITVEKRTVYVSLPYFGPLTHDLGKQLNVVLSPCYPQINFKFCFKNNYRISSFFEFKDSLPAELCANIIYKFSCGSCQGSYIGSTTKQSRIRFFQHLGKSPRTNRPVTVPAHSTPRNHCHENDHLLSLNDFKIIDSANNEHELRILESLYICKEKPSLNIDQSANPLSLF